MSYEIEWMVDLVASFEETEDAVKIHHSLTTTLECENISLLQVYSALKKRAYNVPLNNEVSLRTIFPEERL